MWITQYGFLHVTITIRRLKANMNSGIQLVFFIYRSNLYLKQDIGKVYVVGDYISMGSLELQGTRCKNYKMKHSCP